MSRPYGDDLAHVHDVGFGDFARDAAPGLLAMLRDAAPDGGLVVDLGCGSGLWARELVRVGYDVLGIDLSAGMIRIARRRAPRARFRVASWVDAPLPEGCVAVTSLGEIFNYLFDEGSGRAALRRVFRRVHGALAPGGLFLFDVAEPGRIPGGTSHLHREGDGWAILVDGKERGRRLERRQTIFRRDGRAWRRSEEVHRLRLYRRSELLDDLRGAGFRARPLAGYGALRFRRGHGGILARKPGRAPVRRRSTTRSPR